MSRITRICFILSAVVLLTAVSLFAFSGNVLARAGDPGTGTVLPGQLSEEDLQLLNDGSAGIFVHDDRVTFVAGTCSADPVKSFEDAEKVVVSMIGLLGGDSRTRFESWRELTDSADNHYYVFQQMYANTTVLGGAVKVITDPEGNMIGLTSSIETELPDIEESEGISAAEAEQIVLQHAAETNQPELTLVEDATAKMILPVAITLDINDEETEGARFVWSVYTDNPESRKSPAADLPYLAHYVTMDGEYLYSLPTIIPGDAAGEAGFDAAYVFEFMEPADYTGYVDLYDGTEMELTVTLMRDKRTGMYYLGNIERRIVVADCYSFLFDHNRVVLASSPDNMEWDQVGLLSLYNYCKAWDYFNEIGWPGGDGLNTPILILNDMCDEQHNRIDNAAFIGNYLGWSVFGASLANDFSQALDIIAHEFTHCVTNTVLTHHFYMNDYGAINEALSDIQGEICDLMNGNTDDTDWIIGDQTGMLVRSMSDPHSSNQPEFTWDLYYVPSVITPTAVNDQGGVHSNSSLLNNTAYRLVADGGMSLEEARAFWFAVSCAMVPGTDYKQMRDLLPWMLDTLGMDQYQIPLQRAIDAVRMGNDTLPDFFDNDRALMTLILPDNENFTDDNWMMQIFSVDFEKLFTKAQDIISKLLAGDFSEFPQPVRDLLQNPEEEPVTEEAEKEEMPGFWETFLTAFAEALAESEDQGTAAGDPEKTADVPDEDLSDKELDLLLSWLKDEFKDSVYFGIGSAGQDGRTIRMVTRPGRTIPVLIHMAFNGISTVPDQVVYAVYVNGTWYDSDLTELFEQAMDPQEDPEASADLEIVFWDLPVVRDLVNNTLENIGNIKSIDDVLDLFTYNIRAGEVNEISSNGLETVVLPEPSEETETETDTGAPELPEPGKKSRPKL